VVQTLSDWGYTCFTAEDGTDALALYFDRRNEIDLVLTDVCMGMMDGITLTRAIKKLNPNARVVASSGQFQKENRAAFGAMGVTHLLEKPYTGEKLLRTVRDALSEAPASK
jgi:CheY-like chemotaxis protein